MILPPLGNDFNGMLKNTTLVSVIGVPELLLATQMITSATFRVFELYLVVALYYLTLTTLWGFVQQWIERRFGEPSQGNAAGNGLLAGGIEWVRAYRLQLGPLAHDVISPSPVGGLPANATEIVVEATDVHKSFGPLEVLKGVSLTVRRGEVVVIVGASGSGKATLIRCLNHLEKINRGRILVNGHLIGYREREDRLIEDRERNIARQRQEIGMVFQRFNLFPHLTAVGNIIEAPMQVRGVPKAAAVETARALLARIGLSDKENAYPAQLSGGQQQRVAIARALAMRPALMLFERADQRARSRDDRRGAGSDEGAGPRGHDDDRRQPRDGLRPRGRRPHGHDA